MDSQLDYSNEAAVCEALTCWGISTPRLIAHGMIQDTYLFYYIITEYCPGELAGPWLECASPSQLEGFIRQLKELLQTMHRPAQGLIPPMDLLTNTVLVHGDLTGENILIGANDQPIIIDCSDSCPAPGGMSWPRWSLSFSTAAGICCGCSRTPIQRYSQNKS